MTSLASRAHPFTPAAVALALCIMAIVAPSPQGTAIVYAATVVIAAVTGTSRGVRLGALICAPLWILLFIMHGVLGEEPDRIVAGLSLSESGLRWALTQGLRLGAIITASLAFATSFDPNRFLQAAIDRKWRFDLSFLLVATLDAAERLGAQARRVREAQRARGLKVTGTLVTRIRAVPALALPVMLIALTEADDRALALETRGFTLQRSRSAIAPPPDSTVDRTIRWVALAAVIATAWWRFG